LSTEPNPFLDPAKYVQLARGRAPTLAGSVVLKYTFDAEVEVFSDFRIRQPAKFYIIILKQ